jgi:hypothetical protein
MSTMKKLLCCLSLAVACLAGPLPAHATPNPSHVSADAVWAFQADFNAMRETALGKEFIKFLRSQKFSTNNFLALNTDKVLGAIGSITAYDEKDGSGGFLLHGSDELRKIVEAIFVNATLQKETTTDTFVVTYSEIQGAPFPTYSVRIKPKPGIKSDLPPDLPESVFAFPPEPVILVGESQAQITLLREVLLGSKPSLAQTPDAALAQSMREAGDAYLYFGTTSLPSEKTAGNAPQSRILRLSKSASLAIGESGPQTFARAHLLADSEATAAKLLKVVEGLTAMLSLAESKDADINAFLNSVKVHKSNQTVTTEISYPSARILNMFQTLLRRLGDNLKDKIDAKKKDAPETAAEFDGSRHHVSRTAGTRGIHLSPALALNP